MNKTLAQEISMLINERYQLAHFEIENESAKHSADLGAESHFKLTVVSDEWENVPRIKRHREIYSLLASPMKKIHAMALHLYTCSEWEAIGRARPDSPRCHNTN